MGIIGSLNPNCREVTIIGAGIAGMLMAHTLDQNGYIVTLCEEKARAGGLLRTHRTQYGIAEAAANSLLISPAVKKLCAELSVDLVEVRPEARARYILREGRLRKFPLTTREALGALRRAAFAPATNHAEAMDLGDWGLRHLGPAAVDYLLTPLAGGIYGVRPHEVGVAAAIPKLLIPPGQTLLSSLLRKSMKRSEPKEQHPRMGAPKGGMGELITKLQSRLEKSLGARFRRGVKVNELPAAANIVVSTPAYRAADLIERESADLARLLRAVRYTPMVSVTAFVQRKSFTRPVSGVGVLIPASENRRSLGILFSSSALAGRVTKESQVASFTLMMGGSADRDWVNASDEAINQAVQLELNEILGLSGAPLETIITRWPQAIPQYSIDLPKLWTCARETWCATPGRMLFGNYTGQVSLRGMIESAGSLR